MSDRKLAILGVVAAAMVVLTVVQARFGRTPARRGQGGAYLIQGLETAKIAGIVIGKGENPVRLVREGNGFVVGNRDDYPAAIRKINDLIRSCRDIRTIELITSNAANHESLHVSEERAQSVVKFLDGDGEVITGVVIGSSRLPELQMENRSTYVRLVSSDDVFEARKVPMVGGSATDYIDKDLVDVDRSEVSRVTVSGPNESYTLRADDSNEDSVVLENMPTGKKLKEGDCEQVLSALSSLSFDDVRKESSFEEGELKFDGTYVCELRDSRVYTLELAATGSKTYVKCRAEFTGEARVMVEGQEELEDIEARYLARDGAVEFTKSHGGWVYEISDWNAKKLTKNMADLLEEQEPEQEKVGEQEEKADESASIGGGETEGEQPG